MSSNQKDKPKMIIKLPQQKRDEIVDFELEPGKPVVMLGANGSGKTRLSNKIEELNDKRVVTPSVPDGELLIHNISAQKSLSISNTIPLTDIESSKRAVFYGNAYELSTKFVYRYNNNPATHLINDFDQVLALLFAEEHNELQKSHKADREANKNGNERPPIITTITEKATTIWNELLPQRVIDLTGSSVHVNNNAVQYHGKEMSDGERVVLYMICQALILPPDSIIIIDEPEMHIHKAVVKKLWDKLEQERSDCVFIYITHDLDFADSRNTDRILWVKNFDGTNWEYEFLNTLDFENLPNILLYEIIGTRKKILFAEGERNSLDYKLYSEFYKDKDYHIIPCGGCSEVLNIYKSKKIYEKFINIETYCIIDRDFRTAHEITELENEGVTFLGVAEIENLFVVPALLDIMEEQLGCSSGTAQQAKDYITQLFNDTKLGQIGEAFIKEVNHQLTLLNFSDKKATPEEIQNAISSKFSKESIQSFFDEKRVIFDDSNTIDKILKVFNFKGLPMKIGDKFGINKDYKHRVITFLRSNINDIRERILDAIRPYVPELP